MSSNFSALPLDDLQELLFFLIAKRCLVHDGDLCPLSLNALKRQLTLYTLDLSDRKTIDRAIARIRDAGLIKTQDPGSGLPAGPRFFSTLLFQITPLGIDYIDRLLLTDPDPLYSEAYLP